MSESESKGGQTFTVGQPVRVRGEVRYRSCDPRYVGVAFPSAGTLLVCAEDVEAETVAAVSELDRLRQAARDYLSARVNLDKWKRRDPDIIHVRERDAEAAAMKALADAL
jgi:hypothetical protein